MTLGKRSEYRVVSEASDGLEAVQQAEELRPDLIVLDIGLPGINGLEAARRIHKSCPASRILFLSLESDANVVQESLRVGALGYVDKKKAEVDLLAAVEAVSEGRRFVSSGLLADNCTAATGAPGAHSSGDPLRPAPAASSCPHDHEVQFYSEDAALLGNWIPFIISSLKAGNKTVVVATRQHRQAILQQLHANEPECITAIGQGLYIALDAAETLSAFMEDSGPNRKQFRSTFDPLVRCAETHAEARPKRVVVFGEMVAVLLAQGKTRDAIQLEQLWNELLRDHCFILRCAYPATYAQKGELYGGVCAEHSAMLPVSS